MHNFSSSVANVYSHTTLVLLSLVPIATVDVHTAIFTVSVSLHIHV